MISTEATDINPLTSENRVQRDVLLGAEGGQIGGAYLPAACTWARFDAHRPRRGARASRRLRAEVAVVAGAGPAAVSGRIGGEAAERLAAAGDQAFGHARGG